MTGKELNNLPAAFCIAGHHGGLPDLGTRQAEEQTLRRRLMTPIEDYSAYKSDVKIKPAAMPMEKLETPADQTFYIRMLYSCLVDADFLDTESFMSAGAVDRTMGDSFSALLSMLNKYIDPWWNASSTLNIRRCKILKSAIDGGKDPAGMFSLTVPTGGGKTVASMAFALNHVLKNDLCRIIYVIPYTSIIEQTQKVFEGIFGEENVVAHYSNVEYGNDEDGSSKKYLASENWDAPIILTTSVQFFESIYSCRSSSCRKLHNISKSVIIFDEAQMLPVPYLKPCIFAVSELVKHYGCSAVLCTATQPSLGQLFSQTEMLPETKIKELCPAEISKDDVFRRTTYMREGVLSNEQLAEKLSAEEQVLCIVNNRKSAQQVYDMMKGDAKEKYHLSTFMCPEHRQSKLEEIRERLKAGQTCRVVSTSLIEAGVDVDFPVVYRAVAGLDSIIQAGGRCNREGKRKAENSIVHIFEPDSKVPEMIKQNISAAKRVLDSYEDIASAEAVKTYFEFLFYVIKGDDELDRKQVFEDTRTGRFNFRTISERFKLIDNNDYTLYIPINDECKYLLRGLEFSGPSRSLMRKLGRCSVGVRKDLYDALDSVGAVKKISENSAVLTDMQLYDENKGLLSDKPGLKPILI